VNSRSNIGVGKYLRQIAKDVGLTMEEVLKHRQADV
jgi:hypothetical protein